MATFLERKNEERLKYKESQVNEENDFVQGLCDKWAEADRQLDEKRSTLEEEKLANEEQRKEELYNSCVERSESCDLGVLVATFMDLRSFPDYLDANSYAVSVKEKIDGILSAEKAGYIEGIGEIRRKNNLCQHCGSNFSKKICSKCGNPKDY